MSNLASSIDDFLAIREREVLPRQTSGLNSLDDLVDCQKGLSHRQSAGVTLGYIASTSQTGVLSTSRLSQVPTSVNEVEKLIASGASVMSICTENGTTLENKSFFEELVARGDVPFGITSLKVDARGDVEDAFALGFSYLTVGTFLALDNSPRSDAFKVFADQAYQFKLAGALSQLGAEIVVEVVGGSFDVNVPPAVAIAMTILESMFAVECGNRNVVLRYSSLGNIVQDAAALHVMRDIATEALASDVSIYVSAATWPGELPRHVGEAYAALSAGAMAAGLGGADLGAVDRLRGGEFDGWGEHVSAVQAERQLLDMLEGQILEDSELLSNEKSDLRATVEAMLSAVRDGASKTLHEQMMDFVSRGFLPGNGFATDFSVARDELGAVRWIEKGSLPVPALVLEHDRRHLDSTGKRNFEANLVRRYVANDSKQ